MGGASRSHCWRRGARPAVERPSIAVQAAVSAVLALDAECTCWKTQWQNTTCSQPRSTNTALQTRAQGLTPSTRAAPRSPAHQALHEHPRWPRSPVRHGRGREHIQYVPLIVINDLLKCYDRYSRHTAVSQQLHTAGRKPHNTAATVRG